jgi:hypothetical protein
VVVSVIVGLKAWGTKIEFGKEEDKYQIFHQSGENDGE